MYVWLVNFCSYYVLNMYAWCTMVSIMNNFFHWYMDISADWLHLLFLTYTFAVPHLSCTACVYVCVIFRVFISVLLYTVRLHLHLACGGIGEVSYIYHDFKLLSWPVCSITCFNRCLIRLYILPLIEFSSNASCVKPSHTILDKMQNDSDWGIEKQTGKDCIRWS